MSDEEGVSEEEAKERLAKFEITEDQREDANELASGSSSGSVVVKPQLCGKYCSGCPHGPYAWLVNNDGWTYLGRVGGKGADANQNPTEATTDNEELPVVEQVLGELGGDEFRTKMEVEVDEEGNLYVQSNKGNKSLLGVASDMDESGDLDLDIVAYQRPKTKDRASGETRIEAGDIIKTEDWSHSGKNSKERYAIYDGEQLRQIDKGDAHEIVYRRSRDVANDSVVVRNADRFGVDNTRSGSGWIQRLNDYDPSQYQYNWDSEFVNSVIESYEEGEIIRTSKDEFYAVEGEELVEVDEEDAKEAVAKLD